MRKENVKWKYEPYAYYDKAAIEAHLTEMARDGWMIESMGLFWKYQKIESAKGTFEAVYFPNLDQTKGDLTPTQREHKEKLDNLLASRTENGWDLKTVHNEMLVFYSEEAKPLPTKEEARQSLDDIKSSMKKGRIASILCLSLFTLSNILSCTMSPLHMVMSMEGLIAIFIFGALIWMLSTWFSYKRWHKAALREVEETGKIPVLKERLLGKNGVEIFPLVFLGMLFFLQADKLLGQLASIGILLLLIPFLQFSQWSTDKGNYKRLKGIKGRNYNILVTIITLLLVFGFSVLVVGSEAELFDMGKTEPPLLGIHDLNEDDDEGDTYWYRDYETFFAKTEEWEYSPVSCYYVKVKKAAFYDIILKLFCKEKSFDVATMEEQDPAPWGAEKVYNDRDHYLILWDDIIMSMEFLFEDGPTDKQIAAIKVKLGK